MIKLIPIIIFPLSFFLIFLGVKNLTDNFSFNYENIDQNNKEKIVKFNQDSEKTEAKIEAELEENLINNEQQSINVDGSFQSTDEKEKKIIKGENVNEGFEKKNFKLNLKKQKAILKKVKKKLTILMLLKKTQRTI